MWWSLCAGSEGPMGEFIEVESVTAAPADPPARSTPPARSRSAERFEAEISTA